MELLHQPQHFTICWLRTANFILLFCWLQSCFAYGDIYVTNSSLIYDACTRSCETSQVEPILIGDCQRGCRLFDTLFLQNSIFSQFDDTIALPNCQQSCSEAYGSAISAIMACFGGCTNAQQEYHTRSVMQLQRINEFFRNLTYVDWFPKRPKTIDNFSSILNSGKSVRRLEEAITTTTTPRNGLNVANPKKSLVTVSPNLNQEPAAASPVDDQTTWRGTSTKQSAFKIPNWMSHSALAIFVVGVTMLLAACCYCCAFGHYHINKSMPSRSKSIDSELPPSYEHLMGNAV